MLLVQSISNKKYIYSIANFTFTFTFTWVEDLSSSSITHTTCLPFPGQQ